MLPACPMPPCTVHHKVWDLLLTSVASQCSVCYTLFIRGGLLLTSSGDYSLVLFI